MWVPFHYGCPSPMRAVRLLGEAFLRGGVRPTFPSSPLWTAAGPRGRTGYIICKAQCKMKVQDHLFKKPEKSVIKGIKDENFFLSSVVFPSTCHGVFIKKNTIYIY